MSTTEITKVKASETVVSTANVRTKSNVKDIDNLAASLLSNKQAQPCLGRIENGKIAIFVGQRRRAAAIKNEQINPDFELDVIVKDIDDAEAVALSLSENIDRDDMSPIDQWKAFTKLIKSGWDIHSIAETFSIKEIDVKKTLALGSAPTIILQAFEKGDIDKEALKIIVMRDKATQKRFINEYKKDGDYPTYGYEMQRFCNRMNQRIRATHALFDIEKSKIASTDDLFEGDTFIDDVEAYWELQNKEIEKLKAQYEEKGWKVEVAREGFDKYNLVKFPKKQGGRVYIAAYENGSVEINEGYITMSEKEALEKVKRDITGDGAHDETPEKEKNEVTAKLNEYVLAYRCQAAKSTVLLDHKIALRVFVFMSIAHDGSWDFKYRSQFDRADEELTHGQLGNSKKGKEYLVKANKLTSLLGVNSEWYREFGHNKQKLFDKVMKLSEAQLNDVFALIVADALLMDSFSSGVELIHKQWKPNMQDYWNAKDDDAFFDLIQGKDQLSLINSGHFPKTDLQGKKVKEMRQELTDKSKKASNFIPKYLMAQHYGNGKGLTCTKK